ncbi:MAG: MarR family transcriptional regulator, partial [Dactylosporangium sp.]|nr:MarR family transcriptional regulator [Dactylosporangium sp.]
MSEQDELIAEIMGTMHRMQHLLVADRSSPLLNSTLTMQQLKVLLV